MSKLVIYSFLNYLTIELLHLSLDSNCSMSKVHLIPKAVIINEIIIRKQFTEVKYIQNIAGIRGVISGRKSAVWNVTIPTGAGKNKVVLPNRTR